ncbi:branched-chain amino acid aminotransferase II [Penicillium atrosanguineum]|nr:branched-chain amino acid aminotransferase II [Penicillium atrosanguineum]
MPAGGKGLLTSPDDIVRSWVGGLGHAKVGANYGPSVAASQEAARQGFHQILWLYGDQGKCTEAGGSNFFVVWKRKDGDTELLAAPLDDRLIFDGVIRRERLEGQIEVTERKFTIDDLAEAASEDRLPKAFSADTALIDVSMGSDGGPSEVTGKLKKLLYDIM